MKTADLIEAILYVTLGGQDSVRKDFLQEVRGCRFVHIKFHHPKRLWYSICILIYDIYIYISWSVYMYIWYVSTYIYIYIYIIGGCRGCKKSWLSGVFDWLTVFPDSIGWKECETRPGPGKGCSCYLGIASRTALRLNKIINERCPEAMNRPVAMNKQVT